MLISDFAIKKPLITVVTMLSLVVFGLFAVYKLQTDEFPDIAAPIVVVQIPYPGASPNQVETELLNPIEEGIQGIAGVSEIQGQAFDGFAQIVVQYQFGKPQQEQTQDIRDAISLIRQNLPTEMKEPILQRFDPNSLPIVSLALVSPSLTPGELRQLADPGITREMRAIAGVANVTVSGGREREMTVQLRPDALQASETSVAEVVAALGSQNLAAPVGNLQGALQERTIRLAGRLETPDEFKQLVVKQRGGVAVRLGDVADVFDGYAEQRTLAEYNGKEAVGIDIVKSKGYSTTAVSNQVIGRIDALRKKLPKGVDLTVIQNAGVRVDASVRGVVEALFEGALLTVLVVFLFLNSWRSTVITGLALPVSVMASFVAVWIAGFTLNSMSLLGLSLAIGILIDDAIVVRENIVRHVEMGKDHFTAARDGTDEIGLAVAATTFSIVAVFVPVAFMSGLAGQWFKPFALTIACSVLVSLFVSFSLDPMLSAYWPDPHQEEHEKWRVTRVLDRFNNWFNRQSDRYREIIAWALDHRAAMVVLAIGVFFASFSLLSSGIIGLLAAFVGLAVLVFGMTSKRLAFAMRFPFAVAGLAAFFLLPKVVPVYGKVGTEFFGEDDRSEFNINVDTPPGSSLEYTRLKAEEAARLAKRHPEVLYTYTKLGGATGAVDNAQIYVKLVPKKTRTIGQNALGEVVRRETAGIGGASVGIFASSFGGNQKQVQLQMHGPDAASLARAADDVLAVVKTVPGAVDADLSSKGQKPELEVVLNRGLAGQLGISAGQVAQSLRPAFAGLDAGDWQDPTGETRDVTVRFAPEYRQKVTDLQQLPLLMTGPAGPTTIPLGQIATVRQALGPAIIEHLDRDRVVTVQANVNGRPLGDVMADINARIKQRVRLPAGVEISQGGQSKDQAEVFGNIFLALGVAVLLMYLILVIQFGSFLDPLAILVSLPLSLIGVLLALAATGNTINLMSLIGVILLSGIVAKNAILLIDFAKWSREQGMELREALIHAGAIRLRPILMTTFALVAGMLPVALGRAEGSGWRAPLGIAVIGGVLTSTFLTLLVIPTVYEIMDDFREWSFGIFRRGSHSEARERSHGHGHGPVGTHPVPEPGD
ncbi:MAG: acriflavin resistance protein [Gemmatimonadetes bacterium]|nr:acriflavin resistance protein [Gemmatimonadota bacterium]